MFLAMDAACWEAIGTCLYAVATVALAVVGILGLATWKKQMRGATEYELARRILRKLMDVRDAFKLVRVSWIFSIEWFERPGRDPDPSKPISLDDMLWAYSKRLSHLSVEMAGLRAALLDAEIAWGAEDLSPPMAELENLVGELSGAVRVFASAERRVKPDGLPSDADGKRREKALEILEEASPNDDADAFAARLQHAIEKFRKVLDRKIGTRSR